MAKKTRDAASSSAESSDAPSFEDAITEVERIVEQIESGEIGLEASLARYERGASLVKHCRELLARAEQRIEELDRQMSQDSGAEPGSDAGPGAD